MKLPQKSCGYSDKMKKFQKLIAKGLIDAKLMLNKYKE
jgi:hypothetical protein